jgi:hypothetical protein
MRPKLGPAFLLLFASASAPLASACAAVPDVQFADADVAAMDGGTESGAVTPDAQGADDSAVASDADPADADAGPPAMTCPATPPPTGVNACCGATPCIDRSGNNLCAQCAACTQLGCKTSEVCCYAMNNGNLGCKKSAMDCK